MLLMAQCLARGLLHPSRPTAARVFVHMGLGLLGGCDPMGPITPNQTQRETQPAYFSVMVCVSVRVYVCVCVCVCVCL